MFNSLIHSAVATKVIMVSHWRCILPKTSVYTCGVLKQPACMLILATIFICKMWLRSIFILDHIVVFQRFLSLRLQFKSKSMIGVQLRPLVELFLAFKDLYCLMPNPRWCEGFFRVCLVFLPVKLWPSFLYYARIHKDYLGLHKDRIRSVKSYRVQHFAIAYKLIVGWLAQKYTRHTLHLCERLMRLHLYEMTCRLGIKRIRSVLA